MLEELNQYVPAIVSVLATFAASAATLHVILTKRETRSAIGWIGLSWLTPVLGVALYLAFGVNRIRRRAESLRREFSTFRSAPSEAPLVADELVDELGPEVEHLVPAARVVDRVVERPLLPGNRIEPLFDGDETYPAMLEAIREARTSVTLQTYIFDNDPWGKRFARALGDAVERGVDVRVLIDAAGLRYSFPSILHALRKRGVRVARFLPTIFPPHPTSVNLRNHRKIMVVDGRTGFTGGLNIRQAHVLGDDPHFPTRDLHFRITGPLVAQLQETFVNDWYFAARKEKLRGEKWFPQHERTGDVIARGIWDGPDEDLDKLPWTIQGALSCAKESIRIVTPYFIPDDPLMTALNLASMRGVCVEIIMPAKNNLPFVKWASLGLIRPLLEHGCRLWLTEPPFDHSKLMVVDRMWTLLGSANIDPRSLRLNFEFNVESYSPTFAAQMDDWAQAKLAHARRLTLEEHDERPIPVQVRDGFFRLLSPYL